MAIARGKDRTARMMDMTASFRVEPMMLKILLNSGNRVVAGIHPRKCQIIWHIGA
jgi:hypothetical protein